MIQDFIPALEWLRTYKRDNLRGDLSAGLIVAIMLVPQSMAYAMLAGLPVIIGLYAATIPLLIYALFGSSRHLAVGPVAMMSLLVFAAASKLAQPGSETYIGFVLLLSFMVGAMQFLFGVLRLGFLVHFVSHAVISGFMSAAAIVIFLSQLKHLLGIKIAGGGSVFHILVEVSRNIGDTNLITLMIGLGSICILSILKKKHPLFPSQLVVVIGGTLLVYLLGLEKFGVETVGRVPKGLPSFSIPEFSANWMMLLLPSSITIVFVGFMESIAVAELIAAKEKYKIDPNQELKGLGLANLVGAFVSCYPVTGGLSRTAVNYQAGARTGLASMVTAAVVILTLLFFTPLFFDLPRAVLASIIMTAVMGFVDVEEAKHLFKIKTADGWIWILTFISALAIGIDYGILIGICFSLLLFIWRTSHPHAAEIGYLAQEDVFRNIKRYPQAETYPHILILRVDASLYFANMSFLERFLRKNIAEKPDTRWVIVDFSGVNDIDAVAIHTLEELMDTYREKGLNFALSEMKGPVRDLVAKAGWHEKYGKQVEYLSIKHALRDIRVGDAPD
ncbi:MAG: solute carrier family 26 protein [Deltaproteobacteria bacterium]|nr:MAG: solute carrier family 26 protein [Deltaproteobacteria bacterium]